MIPPEDDPVKAFCERHSLIGHRELEAKPCDFPSFIKGLAFGIAIGGGFGFMLWWHP